MGNWYNLQTDWNVNDINKINILFSYKLVFDKYILKQTPT